MTQEEKERKDTSMETITLERIEAWFGPRDTWPTGFKAYHRKAPDSRIHTYWWPGEVGVSIPIPIDSGSGRGPLAKMAIFCWLLDVLNAKGMCVTYQTCSDSVDVAVRASQDNSHQFLAIGQGSGHSCRLEALVAALDDMLARSENPT